MNEVFVRFQNLLRELFQFDWADLDFGIYRIMNHKRAVIEHFITEDLPRAVNEELDKGALAEQEQAAKDLEAARKKLFDTFDHPFDAEGNLTDESRSSKPGKEYLAAQERAKSAKGREALESAVYNHLYAFFSRYWQDGDFISKRRYSKKERYAIPYNGEEVYLYWANHDQYYIKTGEYFTDYTWKTPNGVTVHFRLKAADVEQNNVKGEKRFFLPLLKEIVWDAETRTFTIPFEFRPLTEQEQIAYGQKNQQEAIIAKAVQDIPKRLPKGALEAAAALSAEKRKTDKGETVTYLEHHLRKYTRRNTSDFFIHRDLRGFLSRELDFYLKNEVLNLEELEAAGENLAEGWFQLLRLVKRLGLAIIEFLAQIEDFQKMLWEKKKFVTETFYVITVGNIPEAFYAEIAENEAQWEEWQALFDIEVPPSPRGGEGRGEGRKSRTKVERNAVIQQFAREMREAPTDAEKRLWFCLRDRRLGGFKFRRQHPMGSYIADFICIEAGIIIELDGGQHAEDEQRKRDAQRTSFFESQGFRVLRFWNHDVLARTEAVLETILDALENAPHPNPLPMGEREKFLKAHPTLPLDTRHFPPDFTDRLLAAFENLDDLTDGLLLHSENWQALNLLQEKYRERVKCVYIDPPYNTNATEIIYKNEYRDSSWLSLIYDRVSKSIGLSAPDGMHCITIDDVECPRLWIELEQLFGSDNYLGTACIRSNPGGRKRKRQLALQHEYALFFAKNSSTQVSKLPVAPEDKSHSYKQDEKGNWFELRNLRKEGIDSAARPDDDRYYPIYYDPKSGRISSKQELPIQIWPIDSKGVKRIWRRSIEDIDHLAASGEIICQQTKSGYQLYFRYRGGLEGETPKSLWVDAKFSASEYGTPILDNILGKREVFDFPKSVYAVAECIQTMSSMRDCFVLDFFAGSGTTGHAVINLNREDGGRRKFILVEMAHYFDTVLLPRIKKVTFTPEWKDGKPKRMATAEEAERSPRIVKVLRLESYEDTLNNLSFDESSGQMALQFEDYLLKYMLTWETRRSETLLNVEKLSKPFDYALHIHHNGETQVQKVDLPETFNYLIGLDVETRKVLDNNGKHYLVYRGVSHEGRRTAVIWRETEGWKEDDYHSDRDFVVRHKLTEGADEVFVNGDSFIPGAQALDGVFKAKMFAGVEV